MGCGRDENARTDSTPLADASPGFLLVQSRRQGEVQGDAATAGGAVGDEAVDVGLEMAKDFEAERINEAAVSDGALEPQADC